jgi:hypothetical protein
MGGEPIESKAQGHHRPVRGIPLALRALLALALMIAFHGLSLALFVGLLVLPVVLASRGDRFPFGIALVCWVGAASLAAPIAPGSRKFQVPGPRLREEDHPRLFALLRRVAEAAGEPLPRSVYLVPQATAWVAQTGGLLGLSRPTGSRRASRDRGPGCDQLRSLLEQRGGAGHRCGIPAAAHGGVPALPRGNGGAGRGGPG